MYSALQGRLKVRGGTGGCALSTLHCALYVCVARVRVRVQGCRGKPGAQLGVQRDRRSRETCSDLPSRCVPRPRRTCGRENLKCRLHLEEDSLTFLLSSKPLSIIPLNSDLNNKFFFWPSLIFYEKLLSWKYVQHISVTYHVSKGASKLRTAKIVYIHFDLVHWNSSGSLLSPVCSFFFFIFFVLLVFLP